MILTRYINLFNDLFGITFEDIKNPKGLVSEQCNYFLCEKLRDRGVSEKGIKSLLGDGVMPKGYLHFVEFIASKEKTPQQ